MSALCSTFPGYSFTTYEAKAVTSVGDFEDGGLIGTEVVDRSQRYITLANVPQLDRGTATAMFDRSLKIHSQAKGVLKSQFSLNVICSVELAKNYVQTWQMKELAVGCVAGFAFYLFGPLNFALLFTGVSALVAAAHFSYLSSGTLSWWGTVSKFIKILASWLAILLFTGFLDYVAYRQLGFNENHWILHYVGLSPFIICGVVLFALYAYLPFKYFKNATKIPEAIEAGFEAVVKVLTKKD